MLVLHCQSHRFFCNFTSRQLMSEGRCLSRMFNGSCDGPICKHQFQGLKCFRHLYVFVNIPNAREESVATLHCRDLWDANLLPCSHHCSICKTGHLQILLSDKNPQQFRWWMQFPPLFIIHSCNNLFLPSDCCTFLQSFYFFPAFPYAFFGLQWVTLGCWVTFSRSVLLRVLTTPVKQAFVGQALLTCERSVQQLSSRALAWPGMFARAHF